MPARMTTAALGLTLAVIAAAPAYAQRFPFERTFDVASHGTLDVATNRGRIEISAGDGPRIVVSGTVTVRTGWDVPANAVEIARAVAARPPVEAAGSTIRLRDPSDRDAQRAVTVSYQVKVPRDTQLVSVSDSGATTVRGLSGTVDVRTQSATIQLHDLGNAATVNSGSGAVTVNDIAGALVVTTSSSAITVRGAKGNITAKTQSGAIDVALTGPGDVDVQTGSSGIRAIGMRGAFAATTDSGRVIANGTPKGTWTISTGSGSVELSVPGPAMNLDATTGSGSIVVDSPQIDGQVTQRKVTGRVGGGGGSVTINSRSGSIRISNR